MNNNIRVFLWLGLALALWINYTQWQQDYSPKATAALSAGEKGNNSAEVLKPVDLSESVPQAVQTVPGEVMAEVPAPVESADPGAPAASNQKVRVVTDVLVLDISLQGGDLIRAELPGYPVVKGEAAPVVLLNQDNPSTNYVMQTGLGATDKGPAQTPTHQAAFQSAADRYELAPGQNELRVPLTWSESGVTVTKTFIFERGMFAIELEYSIQNQSASPWSAVSYAQIYRSDPAVERSMFKVESFAFRGPAIWDGEKYIRLDIEETDDQQLSVDVQNGWLAGMQHHFTTAVVPNPEGLYRFTLGAAGRQYLLRAVGPVKIVPAGGSATLTESLFVGPKLQKQLETLHPELSRVADYGMLTPLAKPLFWVLEKAHQLVNNWGLAIILATLLLKLMFYPLSEKAGRSMARMRVLAPRMKALQETYKDDRAKLGQATMELYRSEKVNPVAGCLPMLIQMPVFIAFYWVLLESVEMRQAPFFGWINDLSARDPFFILPALNGLAMWFQYKLNPPPPDPMQAKIFQFMPLVFSVMFAVFPAGLVLYWVTNTGLSILQQWNINRRIGAETKPRK